MERYVIQIYELLQIIIFILGEVGGLLIDLGGYSCFDNYIFIAMVDWITIFEMEYVSIDYYYMS